MWVSMHRGVLKLLLLRKARVDWQDTDGLSALAVACSHNQLQVIQVSTIHLS